MRNIIVFLFKTCLLMFIIGGTCLVLGQSAGILFQKGDWIIKSWEIFANPTFIISAIAGIFGFILGYFPKEKEEKAKVYSSGEVNEELELVR